MTRFVIVSVYLTLTESCESCYNLDNTVTALKEKDYFVGVSYSSSISISYLQFRRIETMDLQVAVFEFDG